MLSALNIASYLLKLSEENNDKFDTLKLIKLTYLCNGIYMANYKKPLFKELTEAWLYGPVIPEVYQKIKQYKGDNIPVFALSNYENSLDEQQQYFTKQVYDLYKKFSGVELSALTHQDDTPWDIARKNDQQIISNSSIQQHFENLINEE